MVVERTLVLGGAGFLGSYIVDRLLERDNVQVQVLDLRIPVSQDSRVQYHAGDLCDGPRLLAFLREVKPTLIYHAIAPIHGASDEIQHRVNVEGTRTLLNACRDPSLSRCVSKLVYTSSTGVVWNIKDLHGVSEDQVTPPSQGYDSYHHSKAIAERLVLEADGLNGLRTVVLRPCGMLGPKDKQLMHRFASLLERKQHKVQIGDNTNLNDWAYAGNVADAHILAADRLPSSTDHRPHLVAGQVFFITNGSPIPVWDFSRMIWRELGAPPADLDPNNVTHIPRWLALLIAMLAETWCKLSGGRTEFTRFAVQYATATQWYNIDKARKILGYEPRVSLEDAVKKSVQWWRECGAREFAEASQNAARSN